MNGVLYFPFIEIRHMEWLYQVLLYWDRVGIIIPTDYIHNPHLFDNEEIRLLIQEGLIRQILPGDHLPNNGFQNAFLEYLDSNIDDLRYANREITFKPMLIYNEKLTHEIGYQLVSRNLAIRRGGNYYLEEGIGYVYMSALASFLGMKENLQPLTDNPNHLRGFTSTVLKTVNINKNPLNVTEKNELRLKILKDLLPVPTSKVPIETLIQIRQSHSRQLIEFRQSIEKFIANLDYLPKDAHEYEIKKFLFEFDKEKQDIKQSLTRWIPNTAMATLLATAGTILTAFEDLSPLTATGAALCATSFFASIWQEKNRVNKHPLAYVINVNNRFLR